MKRKIRHVVLKVGFNALRDNNATLLIFIFQLVVLWNIVVIFNNMKYKMKNCAYIINHDISEWQRI